MFVYYVCPWVSMCVEPRSQAYSVFFFIIQLAFIQKLGIKYVSITIVQIYIKKYLK